MGEDRKPSGGIALPLIRSAQLSDADDLARYYTLPGVSVGTSTGPYQSPDTLRAKLQLNGPDRRLLVALAGSTIVGTAHLERQTGRRSHVGSIGVTVHDDWTRKGIGSALLSTVLDLADNWLGLRRLELATITMNVPAQAFFRRFGFNVEGTHRNYLLQAGNLVDALTMARVRP